MYCLSVYPLVESENPDISWAGRVWAHGRAAGQGRAEWDANGTVCPGDNRPSYPRRNRRHVARTSPQKSKQTNFYLNRTRERNQRLPGGLSAVYPRLITRTASALAFWLLTSGPTPFSHCKSFSCKACPGKSTNKRSLM